MQADVQRYDRKESFEPRILDTDGLISLER